MDIPSETTVTPADSAKFAVQLLLDEAIKTYRRIYNTALWFLILGLLVAAAGILYFYLANDAIFIDRAAYEKRINTLEAEKEKASTDLQNFVSYYSQSLSSDSTSIKLLNKTLRFNENVVKAYKDVYDGIMESGSQRTVQLKLDKIYSLLPDMDEKVNGYTIQRYIVERAVDKINQKDEKAGELVKKFVKETAKRVRPKTVSEDDRDDKPGLIFSPKLVYGFLSRLGGLVFIEFIAFFLLRQYRVNMNDFRYYYGIARQARINLYLLDTAEGIGDNATRIDVVSKLFNAPVDKPATAEESPIATADVDAARKLLETIKDLIKR